MLDEDESAKNLLPQIGYLRQAQLVPDIVPVSSATLWRMVKAGSFPKPVKLSERCTAWRVEDVHAWMASKQKNSTSENKEHGYDR